MAGSADDWIDRLGLVPHPEGGYYRETYRAAGTVEVRAPGRSEIRARASSTAIHFLLRGGQVSALHRIAWDELWHFYAGHPLALTLIGEDAGLTTIRLGPSPESGQVFQALVPAGTWFGAEVLDATGWALVGCTVAPGFDFADLELGDRAALIARYPRHREVIERLTRAP